MNANGGERDRIDPRVFDRFNAGETIETNGSPEQALRRLVLGDDKNSN